MLSRLISAIVVALTFLGALTLPTAPPASAVVGGSCSVVVPPTVWIAKPYTYISASLAPNCAASGATFSLWEVRHSHYGPSASFLFDTNSSDRYGFYDLEHYGTYYVEPGFSNDSDFNDLTQNTRSFVVKSGSGIGLSGTRLGQYVTLRTSTSYYSPSVSGYRVWPNAKVQLQYKACSSCTWTYLRNVYTASNGVVTFRTHAPSTRYYRAVSTANPTIWGRTSVIVTR
ncbi:MAG: hypothetical protein QOE58_395 [Actinomycetota bacterium]|jgi:hypothetical protein|nr:hypothetical protein [Actinomycetota bacterium]